MDIRTIDVQYYSTSYLICKKDRMFHKKSLPYLSIVQASEGSYGIGIDSPDEQLTGEMGAFIAPREKTQYITHYVNKDTNSMEAHWIFLDVIVNKMFYLDDLFVFPVILPKQYNEEVYNIIYSVRNNSSICDNLSDIYKLIKILIDTSIYKNQWDMDINRIRYYINQNYTRKITPTQLAEQFSMSVPTLFRKFKKHLGQTPSNYINSIRLSQASHLLETTSFSISEIGESVGFDDIFYFSRLFKLKYGISPMNYRKQISSANSDPLTKKQNL